MTILRHGLFLALLFGLLLAAGERASVLAQTQAAAVDGRHPVDVVPPLAGPALASMPAGLSARRTMVGGLENGGQVLALDFAAADDSVQALGGSGALDDTGAGDQRGMLGRWFDNVAYWLGTAYTTVTDGFTPPSPETFAKGMRTSSPDDFWKLVGDAGYKLKGISTDVGLVPDVAFSFRYVRELSDGDINWLERKLRHHENKYHDPLSYAQRAIIYTLLSINTSNYYYVEELKVKLLPLPTASFNLNPWDNDLNWEHDTLLRAIQGQKHARRKPVEEESRY